MKTDIEIAQETKMLPITTVASQYGITEDDLELYGKYKAKISNELWQEIKDRPDGKLVLVTAINPTPAGEGKTTTSIGLAQAMTKCGKKAMLALRDRVRNADAVHIYDFFLKESGVATHDSLYLQAFIDSGSYNRTDCRIHSRGISAAGQYSDCSDFFL